jgi:hypothetical protein
VEPVPLCPAPYLALSQPYHYGARAGARTEMLVMVMSEPWLTTTSMTPDSSAVVTFLLAAPAAGRSRRALRVARMQGEANERRCAALETHVCRRRGGCRRRKCSEPSGR